MSSSNSSLVATTRNIVLLYGLERFGYYGFRVLLFAYMAEIGINDFTSGQWYNNYVSLGYVLPALMGVLSDFVVGYKRSAYVGAIWYAISMLALIVVGGEALFVVLIGCAIGSGFLRVGMLSLLFRKFARNDSRRDVAATATYASANIGGLASTLLIPMVAAAIGFEAAFGLLAFSSIGLASGLYALKRNYAPAVEASNETSGLNDRYAAEQILDFQEIAEANNESDNSIPENERKFGWMSFVLLPIATVVFWAAHDHLYWQVYEIGLVTGNDQSTLDIITPIVTVLLLGLSIPILLWMHRNKRRFHYLFRFAIALSFTTAAVFILFQLWAPGGYDFFTLALGAYLLQALGECFLTLYNYSYLTRLVNPKYVGTTIGLFSLVFYGSHQANNFLNDTNLTFVATVLAVVALLLAIVGLLFFRKKAF